MIIMIMIIIIITIIIIIIIIIILIIIIIIMIIDKGKINLSMVKKDSLVISITTCLYRSFLRYQMDEKAY